MRFKGLERSANIRKRKASSSPGLALPTEPTVYNTSGAFVAEGLQAVNKENQPAESSKKSPTTNPQSLPIAHVTMFLLSFPFPRMLLTRFASYTPQNIPVLVSDPPQRSVGSKPQGS
jgi:hypothetical protein